MNYVTFTTLRNFSINTEVILKFLASDWSTYLGLLRDNHLVRNAGLIIQNGGLFIGHSFMLRSPNQTTNEIRRSYKNDQ